SRHPSEGATKRPSSSGIESADPRSVPIHHEPLIATSATPRRCAGISSSIAEFTALYSPPIPAPASIRKIAKLQKFHENAVSSVHARYQLSVTRNSLRRPSLSVR